MAFRNFRIIMNHTPPPPTPPASLPSLGKEGNGLEAEVQPTADQGLDLNDVPNGNEGRSRRSLRYACHGLGPESPARIGALELGGQDEARQAHAQEGSEGTAAISVDVGPPPPGRQG